MIVVVVDTTSTFVDVMLRKTPWTKLLTLCARSKLRLVIPEPVTRETARHWTAAADHAVDLFAKRLGGLLKDRERFKDLGLDADAVPSIESTAVGVNGEAFLEQMLERLHMLGVETPPVPASLTIEAILKRDLERKKPFEKSGKGFRDVLCWETLVEVVQDADPNDRVIFVSDNSSDYCENDQLAPEFLSELGELSTRLTWVRFIDDLLTSDEVAPLTAGLETSDEALEQFLRNDAESDDSGYELRTVGEVVRAAIVDEIEGMVDKEINDDLDYPPTYDFSSLGIPPEIQNLTIMHAELNKDSIDWQTYDTYDEMTLMIRADGDADFSMDGFAYKSDAYHLEGGNGVDVDIWDWDWSDHLAHISVQVQAHVIFQMRLGQDMDFVEDCEVESIGPIRLISDGTDSNF